MTEEVTGAEPPGVLSALWTLSEADQARLDAALERSLEHGAVGQLAGRVAHDINNFLGAVSGFAELLARPRTEEDRKKFAERILTCCDSAAALNRRLLGLSLREGAALRDVTALRDAAAAAKAEPRVVDVHQVTEEVLTLIDSQRSPRVETRRELNASVATVVGDALKLGHVLVQLALNARAAMPDGGVLSVITETVDLAGADAHEHALPPGRYVSLAIADTGRGMTPETLRRVFDPFFSTKPASTGLGLTFALRTAKQHGGTLRAESTPGDGSRFTLMLPVYDDPASP